MNQESIYFLVATSTALMLALQLSGFWWKQRSKQAIGYWVLAIWILALSDCLFLLSNQIQSDAIRLISRSMITAAYGTLYLGAQRSAGRKPNLSLMLGIVAAYALALAFVFKGNAWPMERAMTSRLVWGVFCLMAALSLRKTNKRFYGSIGAPSTILLLQAGYLIARGLLFGLLPDAKEATFQALLTYADYVNTVLFDVALFVSLLITLVNVSNDEVLKSHEEVQALSKLLPVCAWCRKVRDDDGYWHEITSYFSRKKGMRVTHGICQACEHTLHLKLDAPDEESSKEP
jgi:hypothetical protein